jgi:5-methylcytosine-specific restriction endonuclease McrA
MNKELRKRVYGKYGGKCAYCGRHVECKDFQVDHIIPKGRFHVYTHKPDYKVNDFENLNPACRRCNHYKRSYLLEDFRQLVRTIHERISKEYINKVAIDYGVIELKPFDGVFYFECNCPVLKKCKEEV